MIDGVVLTIRQPLTDAELNALFAAAWPDHRQAQFGPVLHRTPATCSRRPSSASIALSDLMSSRFAALRRYLQDVTYSVEILHDQRVEHVEWDLGDASVMVSPGPAVVERRPGCTGTTVPWSAAPPRVR
jgi:hypothetical protein